jgi:Protein of unknown function (DUF1553)/Protein of unknown function (DUF1549)/Planctomycete cytochrome C
MTNLLPMLFVTGVVAAGPTESRSEYTRDIRPILSSHCFQCHGPDDKARKGYLRLDERTSALKELPTGNRAIVPRNPGESELLERVTTDDDAAAMPPRKFGKRLTAAEVASLRRWIEQDAKYALHWAYVKPIQLAPPPVSDPLWPRNAIDRFIMARLDRERLRPSVPAGQLTLLRRVALDLTGLPPSPDEVELFETDYRPDAYERAVDRLLAKPSFGERWAAVWLDLARYGDSQGYIHDPPRTIWRWRDWLIKALNENLPYDRFTVELLAGDLLPGASPDQVAASGFHHNTTNNTEGGAIAEEYRHASVVDRVNTTMQVWMGSTIACAQCHNHKYDPFTQKDYYQLFAIFNTTEDNNSEVPVLDIARIGCEAEYASLTDQLVEAKKNLDVEIRQIDARRADWEKSIDRSKLPNAIADILAIAPVRRTKMQQDLLAGHHHGLSVRWSHLSKWIAVLQVRLDQVGTTTLVMKEGPKRATHVAIRGEYQNKGEPVVPGVPAFLNSVPTNAKLDRLGLARWIVDPDNPLTARVGVNRLWQELFGIGLVETSEEFGNQGEPPSHPELLDWLATEYIRLGWDTKRLLKLIVTSATYRQSSRVSDPLAKRDPNNRLLARGPRVRLSAESVRDQALFVAGLASSKMYGPPVHPLQPVNGLSAAFGPSTDWENSRGDDGHRRALYTQWRRNLPYPSMLTFDAPERTVCSMRRIRTNTPLQALVTLNDPVYIEAAQALARRILTEGGPTTLSRAQFGARIVLARPPTQREARRIAGLFEVSRSSLAADPARASILATKPIGPLPAGMDAVEAAAWTVVGNVLLNLDETLAKP